jgi:hypothetical protein
VYDLWFVDPSSKMLVFAFSILSVHLIIGQVLSLTPVESAFNQPAKAFKETAIPWFPSGPSFPLGKDRAGRGCRGSLPSDTFLTLS